MFLLDEKKKVNTKGGCWACGSWAVTVCALCPSLWLPSGKWKVAEIQDLPCFNPSNGGIIGLYQEDKL